MREITIKSKDIILGEDFLLALAAIDFDRLKTYLHPQVRFRALVPSGLRQAASAEETVGWLQYWFGSADEFQLLKSSASQMADRLYLTYRIRLHDDKGWRKIEQQVYCSTSNDHIESMDLLCSGFRYDTDGQGEPGQEESTMGDDQTTETRREADLFYDAGNKGCTEGPIAEIARLMRQMTSGQTLEVRATDPSVAADLPAWCRMAGHEFVKAEEGRYLIRRK